MDADSALLLLDMGDRVELAARELLAALDTLPINTIKSQLPRGPVERLRRALDAETARRLAERRAEARR